MQTMLATPMMPTRTNNQRQPNCWPTKVASGTPSTLATDKPIMTMEMARPRLVGTTMEAASTAATPKKAPCGRPAMKRVTSNVV